MKEIEKQINDFVGGQIRSVRKKLGVTQQELGKELGIAPQQVQKYEKGENRLSAGKLFILSRAIDVPVQYFFPESDPDDQEAVPPRTVAIMRIINRLPARCFDDLSGILRSILRISTGTKDKGGDDSVS